MSRAVPNDLKRFFLASAKDLQLAPTLPAVIADTKLLPCEVAVAMVRAAAVVSAIRDVTGFAFPVLVAFTVHSAGS